jgi:hypothetical protein
MYERYYETTTGAIVNGALKMATAYGHNEFSGPEVKAGSLTGRAR